MDTISHGIWTYIIMNENRNRLVVIFGAIFPDVFIIGLGLAMIINGQLNISSPWLPQLMSLPGVHLVDSIFHSIILWTTIFMISLILRRKNLKWFVFGIYLHIGIDVVTHQTYLVKYLWPISGSKVSGIVEYRSLWFTLINIGMLIGILGWLFYNRRNCK